jgi:hypothetical protein
MMEIFQRLNCKLHPMPELTLRAPQYLPSRIISPTRCTRSSRRRHVCRVSIASSILFATFFCSNNARFYASQQNSSYLTRSDVPFRLMHVRHRPSAHQARRCAGADVPSLDVLSKVSRQRTQSPDRQLTILGHLRRDLPRNSQNISSRSRPPSPLQTYPDSAGIIARSRCPG